MQVKQIYELVNGALQETLGTSAVLLEDLSNVVEMGNEVFNASAAHIYSKNLINRIGKVNFEAYKYSGRAPSVFMDAWEYGSVRQKITFTLSNATENESWELTDGTSYDPNIFTEPKVEVKYFNGKTTFEVPISITEEMIKQSFASASELNALVSGIFMYIENTLTIATDNLIMRTINNFIGETIHDDNANRCVKLITNYNAGHADDQVTLENCMENPAFVRYMAYILKLYNSRMKVMSTLFNIGGKARFTTQDRMHLVMLDVIKAASDIYLQSETFHNELTALPSAEEVPYWQGSGATYAIGDISKINVKTSAGNTVEQAGVAAVLFDRYALGVSCLNKRTTTNYNGKAEFTNYWFKQDAQYFNDTNENFVVFLLA